jgi:hypothetical protein
MAKEIREEPETQLALALLWQGIPDLHLGVYYTCPRLSGFWLPNMITYTRLEISDVEAQSLILVGKTNNLFAQRRSDRR